MSSALTRKVVLGYVRVLLVMEGLYFVVFWCACFLSPGAGVQGYGPAAVLAVLSAFGLSVPVFLTRGRRWAAAAAIVIEALWTVIGVWLAYGYWSDPPVGEVGAPGGQVAVALFLAAVGAVLSLAAIIGLLLRPVRSYCWADPVKSPVAGWSEQWVRLAWRDPRLFGVSAVVVVFAVVVSGVAGVRYLTGWWEEPPLISVEASGAHALAVSPDGRTLFAADTPDYTDEFTEPHDDGVTVVDLAVGRAGRWIDTGGFVEQLTMMPGGRSLYALVDYADASDYDSEYGTYTGVRLVRIDPAGGRVQQELTFRYGALGPTMVAASDGSRLYVLGAVSRDSWAVTPVDTASGREGQAIPVPSDSQAMAISPDGRTLYVGAGNANGTGPSEVIPVDTRSGKAGSPVRFRYPVTGLAVSHDGRELYAVASSCTSEPCGGWAGELVIVDTVTSAAVRTVRIDPGCDQIQVAPDGRLFILNSDNTLNIANPTTGQVEKTIQTDGFQILTGYSDFYIAPGERTVYLADSFRGVAVIPVAH